jgi:hypothetical protein
MICPGTGADYIRNERCVPPVIDKELQNGPKPFSGLQPFLKINLCVGAVKSIHVAAQEYQDQLDLITQSG